MKRRDLSSRYPVAKDVKVKSSEDIVCYGIYAKALKVQDKCFLILAQVKTLFVRDYVGTWISKIIDHYIIYFLTAII